MAALFFFRILCTLYTNANQEARSHKLLQLPFSSLAWESRETLRTEPSAFSCNKLFAIALCCQGSSILSHLLSDPYTHYKFWIKAFTRKNEGESTSPPLAALTDVFGPSAPMVTNLTCVDDTSIFLEWDRPRNVAHSIDFYFVHYDSPDTREFKVVIIFLLCTLYTDW